MIDTTKALGCLLCACLAVLCCSPAAAETVSPFINSLPMPHHEHFNDFSFEHVIDANANQVVDQGDVLEGVFDFESIGMEGGLAGTTRLSTGGATSPVEVTGYFRILVTGKTLLGLNPAVGPWLFDFGPDAVFERTYGPGAMVAAYEDPANDLDASLPLANLITTATNGTHLVTLGVTGEPGEGWQALVLTDSIPGAAAFGTSAVGFYQANVNRISSPGLAVQVLKAEPSLFAPGTFTEFSLNGQLYGTTSGASLPLSNTTEVFFTVTPEPSTIILLGSGALVLLVLVMRRRRRIA